MNNKIIKAIMEWFAHQIKNPNFSSGLEEAIFSKLTGLFKKIAIAKYKEGALNEDIVNQIIKNENLFATKKAWCSAVLELIIQDCKKSEFPQCAITKETHPLLIKTGNIFVSPKILLNTHIKESLDKGEIPLSLHCVGHFVVSECKFDFRNNEKFHDDIMSKFEEIFKEKLSHQDFPGYKEYKVLYENRYLIDRDITKLQIKKETSSIVNDVFLLKSPCFLTDAVKSFLKSEKTETIKFDCSESGAYFLSCSDKETAMELHQKSGSSCPISDFQEAYIIELNIENIKDLMGILYPERRNDMELLYVERRKTWSLLKSKLDYYKLAIDLSGNANNSISLCHISELKSDELKKLFSEFKFPEEMKTFNCLSLFLESCSEKSEENRKKQEVILDFSVAYKIIENTSFIDEQRNVFLILKILQVDWSKYPAFINRLLSNISMYYAGEYMEWLEVEKQERFFDKYLSLIDAKEDGWNFFLSLRKDTQEKYKEKFLKKFDITSLKDLEDILNSTIPFSNREKIFEVLGDDKGNNFISLIDDLAVLSKFISLSGSIKMKRRVLNQIKKEKHMKIFEPIKGYRDLKNLFILFEYERELISEIICFFKEMKKEEKSIIERLKEAFRPIGMYGSFYIKDMRPSEFMSFRLEEILGTIKNIENLNEFLSGTPHWFQDATLCMIENNRLKEIIGNYPSLSELKEIILMFSVPQVTPMGVTVGLYSLGRFFDCMSEDAKAFLNEQLKNGQEVYRFLSDFDFDTIVWIEEKLGHEFLTKVKSIITEKDFNLFWSKPACAFFIMKILEKAGVKKVASHIKKEAIGEMFDKHLKNRKVVLSFISYLSLEEYGRFFPSVQDLKNLYDFLVYDTRIQKWEVYGTIKDSLGDACHEYIKSIINNFDNPQGLSSILSASFIKEYYPFKGILKHIKPVSREIWKLEENCYIEVNLLIKDIEEKKIEMALMKLSKLSELRDIFNACFSKKTQGHILKFLDKKIFFSLIKNKMSNEQQSFLETLEKILFEDNATAMREYVKNNINGDDLIDLISHIKSESIKITLFDILEKNGQLQGLLCDLFTVKHLLKFSVLHKEVQLKVLNFIKPEEIDGLSTIIELFAFSKNYEEVQWKILRLIGIDKIKSLINKAGQKNANQFYSVCHEAVLIPLNKPEKEEKNSTLLSGNTDFWAAIPTGDTVISQEEITSLSPDNAPRFPSFSNLGN